MTQRPGGPSPGEWHRAAALAAALLGSSDETLALLEQGPTLWFARHPRWAPGPDSAVLRLLRGIHGALPPGEACRVVRRRIWSTAPPSALDHGAVRVAGRRLTTDLQPVPDPTVALPADCRQAVPGALPTPITLPPPGECPAVDDPRAWLAYVDRLARGILREGPRHQADRPIAAALVGPRGELLEAEIHGGGTDRTCHAEARLVRRWWERTSRPFPEGATLYATLQPCKMCAALLWTIAGPQLTVVCGARDTGPAARATILESGQKPPGGGKAVRLIFSGELDRDLWSHRRTIPGRAAEDSSEESPLLRALAPLR